MLLSQIYVSVVSRQIFSSEDMVFSNCDIDVKKARHELGFAMLSYAFYCLSAKIFTSGLPANNTHMPLKVLPGCL